LPVWGARADTLWETVEVAWECGRRKQRWVVSHTALWHTRGLPAVDLRLLRVGAPEEKLWLAAFFCIDLQATPVQIRASVVRRWLIAVT